MSIEKFKAEEWPKGTEINKTPDGKIKIKLKKPTNFKEYDDRIRHIKKKKISKNIFESKKSNSSKQSGIDRINKNNGKWKELDITKGKNYPRRQHQINMHRKKEAEFKEKQNELYINQMGLEGEELDEKKLYDEDIKKLEKQSDLDKAA